MKVLTAVVVIASTASGCSSAPKPMPTPMNHCDPNRFWFGYRHAERCWDIDHTVVVMIEPETDDGQPRPE